VTSIPSVLQLANGKADLGRGLVEASDGSWVALTDQERALLAYLAARPSQDVARDDLLTDVLGYQPGVISRAVDDTIKRLRAKIERIPSRPFHIVGVRGVGYRFVPLDLRESAPSRLRLGSITVDLDRLVAIRPGHEPVSLSAQEGRLLEVLLAHGGRPVPTDELLREVWGIRNKRQRRLVDKLVYRLRAKLEPTTTPRHLRTVRGRGLLLDVEGAAAPPIAPAQARPSSCPPPDVAPIGRDDAIARARREFDRDGAFLCLHGPAGAGKSTIARVIGHSWAGACVYADVQGAEGAAELLSRLERAAGADAEPGAPGARLHAALDALEDPLLIVDNAEIGAHDLARLLDAARRAAPRLRLLVTTRRRLGAPDETVVEVGPLSAAAARALFLDRATRTGVPLADDDPRIEIVIDEVQGLPLALELAASRVRLLGIEGLVARLDRPLELLNPPAAPSGLRDALQRTWQILDPYDRDLLAASTVFQGPFSLDAAEDVLRAASPRPVLDGLQRLLDSAVLHAAGDGRLSPYAGLIELVAEHLGPRFSDRVAAVLPRYVERLAALGGPTGALHDPPPKHCAALRRELPDALVVLERGIGSEADRGRILAWVARLLLRLGQPNRSAKLLAGLGRPPSLAPAVRDALDVVELFALSAVDPSRLEHLAAEVADRAEGACDRDLAAVALGLLLTVGVAFATPDQTAARRARARTLLAQALDPVAEALVRAGLGWSSFRAGDLDEAWALHQDALALARFADAPWTAAAIALSLAGICHFEGRLAEAETFIALARAPAEEWGESHPKRETLDMLGLVRLEQGRLAEAEGIHRQLLEERRVAGDRYGVALQANRLGTIEGYRGDPHRAAFWFNQARGAFALLGDRSRAAAAVYNIGECHRQGGRLEEASVAFSEARDAFRSLGRITHEGIAIGQLGMVAADRGQPVAATALLREALPLLERGRAHARAAEVAAALAELTAHEDPDAALVAVRSAIAALSDGAVSPALVTAHCRHGRIAHRCGRHSEAHEAVARAGELVERLGLLPSSPAARLLAEVRAELP
jgi:DNA-binding response OmpR family regulator/tetratricopeptide (TPR) repeat protein